MIKDTLETHPGREITYLDIGLPQDQEELRQRFKKLAKESKAIYKSYSSKESTQARPRRSRLI